MKSAEVGNGEIDWCNHEASIDGIKQIQLDAIKEGMRRAAELCKNAAHVAKNPLHTDLQIYWQTYDRLQVDVTKAILTAAEQLTEKDLI